MEVGSSESIEITQVGNGFQVTPGFTGGAMKAADTHVFQSMAGLISFLSQHFSHRDSEVFADDAVLSVSEIFSGLMENRIIIVRRNDRIQ